MTTRIELCGRLAIPPALRVTPAGTAVLSLVVDCGPTPSELMMPVVMTGESVRAIASPLKQGVEVQVQGWLRPTLTRNRTGPNGLGVEVVANEIKANGTINNSIRKLNNG